VHPGLGLGEQREDRERPRAHPCRQRRLVQARPDRAEAAGPVLVILGRPLDHDPPPGEHAVVMRHELRPPVVGQAGSPHRREGALGMLWPSVQQRRQEHVAGNPAQGVEMEMQTRHQAAGRCTGTT
jgi:hypothetical protein